MHKAMADYPNMQLDQAIQATADLQEGREAEVGEGNTLIFDFL